jgi:glutaredoxin
MYCERLKDKLEFRDIEFVDINIDDEANEAEYKKLKQLTNSDSVPQVKVGKHIFVPGVSYKTIDQLVDLIIEHLEKN